MNKSLVMLGVAAALAACAAAIAAAAANTQVIEADQPFQLSPGGSAELRSQALRLGLEDVTADSRCPKDVQCVWEGDATLRLWWQRGKAPREFGELHTATNAPHALRMGDMELTLLGLDPVPISSRAIAKQSYVATLRLSRTGLAAPDR
jgi:hypothetical protein